ncbi:hypothetical protein OROMI_017359 [Orobanche minor]
MEDDNLEEDVDADEELDPPSGTPLHPEITSNVYIYELFNEDLRSPPVSSDGMVLKTLETALDCACGPGRANCSEIQPGESCYLPNNVKDHASYAFHSYYHKEGRTPGSCDFKGAAMITTIDLREKSLVKPDDADYFKRWNEPYLKSRESPFSCRDSRVCRSSSDLLRPNKSKTNDNLLRPKNCEREEIVAVR